MCLNLHKSAMCDISGQQLDPKANSGTIQVGLKFQWEIGNKIYFYAALTQFIIAGGILDNAKTQEVVHHIPLKKHSTLTPS